ncbi:hypothetical protein [Sphingomonas sp. ABOLH]|uniref:hypothetical protein n=1 Tax=Sphingomonas sp. ABOLH TaxID=1985881 RepID=UPI0019D22269|nr:hypothetical protein [Sphingomonas sp. ABOLH]
MVGMSALLRVDMPTGQAVDDPQRQHPIGGRHPGAISPEKPAENASIVFWFRDPSPDSSLV